MTDEPWDPTNEEGLGFSGIHSGGTVTVCVAFRVGIADEVALRARHLIDAEGLQPDWGCEVATLQEVAAVKKRVDWSESLLGPLTVQLRAGSSGTASWCRENGTDDCGILNFDAIRDVSRFTPERGQSADHPPTSGMRVRGHLHLARTSERRPGLTRP